MPTNLNIAKEQLAVFCRTRGIRRLAVYGSALRDDFRPDSDVDVLVEFDRGCQVSLMDMAGMEMELSPLFGNRKVDLRTPAELSRYFRARVIQESRVEYERR